jgi:hypothetical protein
MKKIITMAALLIISIIGVGMMRSRVTFFGGNRSSVGDLIIINDTSKNISSAFTKEEKTVSQVVKPGEKTSGGCGLMRIFVSDKNGMYELQYEYPRPAGKPSKISVTQVIDAARTQKMTDDTFEKKGTIEDIQVSYEEVRDLDVTY